MIDRLTSSLFLFLLISSQAFASWTYNPDTRKRDFFKDWYEVSDDLVTVFDTHYLKLDQTTPQTLTGLSDGVLKLSSGVVGTEVLTGTPLRALNVTFDGSGMVPLAGTIAGTIMPYSGTFTGWKLIEVNGVSSSIIVSFKKNGATISGTEKPTLASATSAEDLSLTTWTTAFSKGDVITATIDSVSVGTKFNIVVYAEASS